MMLRSVVDDYLSRAQERDLDIPLLALLPRLLFFDIHFTHGQTEFGRDFIAKFREPDDVVQYSFQIKSGDINQSTWRTVSGQLLEASTSTLSHPNFDSSLPHQVVLVTSGRLVGNANLSFQDINRSLLPKLGKRPIIFWDHEKLLHDLTEKGLEGVYRSVANGFVGYGGFHILYGGILEGKSTRDDIEGHSRAWISDSVNPTGSLTAAAIESEIIAQALRQRGLHYESLHSLSSFIRVLLWRIHEPHEHHDARYLENLYALARRRILEACRDYIGLVKALWTEAGKDIIPIIGDSGTVFTYLIHCARVMEVTGLLILADTEDGKTQEASELITFLADFVRQEPGAARVPSDRWAVSFAMGVLGLIAGGQHPEAKDLIRRATIWLCDRYEQGAGLGGIESNADDEVTTLLGYPFEFITVPTTKTTFLASVLCDLSAYCGDKDLYEAVVNDTRACDLIPQYWQCADNLDLYSLEGRTIVTYPNIDYQANFSPFQDFQFADHVMTEARSFQVAEKLGATSLLFISMLLRDRYFPTLWPRLAPVE